MTRERKVLVTGAGGFIGKHLVGDQLARGHEVTATDVNLGELEAMKLDGRLTCRQVDVRSSKDMRPCMQGADVVFHLAAAHLEVTEDDSYFEDVNARATEELLRIAAEEGVSRFVHCSTAGIYGPLKKLPANEETPAAPDIPYERSKLAAEKVVLAESLRTGLHTVIMRPAWVYGPLCPRTLKLVRAIARRRFFFVGKGENLRHPIYITDILQAFERAATLAVPPGEKLLAAGPEAVTVRQLVAAIAEELGMAYSPPTIPAWLMKPVCFGVEKIAAIAGAEPPFSRRSLKFFSESSAFDISRARRVLGFEPVVGIRQGLRLTIAFYRQRGLL
ncbi:MAG TPA: NAD(P)-dependent oxidoreductase [Woeseiaceae bacterium]|nr:NAD(P)-dependent oxidoreductase [Woeseiaceae bacterium]